MKAWYFLIISIGMLQSVLGTEQCPNQDQTSHVTTRLSARLYQIVLNNPDPQKTRSEKIKKAGVDPKVVVPKARLYQVDESNTYFFVGYKNAVYYEDESGNFKSTTPNANCSIARHGYTAHIFYGEYPNLKEVLSIESFYPADTSSLGPYHLIGCNSDSFFDYSSLNLLKSQWKDHEKVTHKLTHIPKIGNEEFFKSIQLIEDKKK